MKKFVLTSIIFTLSLNAFAQPTDELTKFEFQIVSPLSGKCLDVEREKMYDNGARVQLWDCQDSYPINQVFLLESLEDQPDAVRIVSKASGKVLDVQGQSSENGAVVHVWRKLNQANQIWKIEQVSEDIYRFRVTHTNKVLDVQHGHSFNNGAKIKQWDEVKPTVPQQTWELRRVRVRILTGKRTFYKINMDYDEGGKRRYLSECEGNLGSLNESMVPGNAIWICTKRDRTNYGGGKDVSTACFKCMVDEADMPSEFQSAEHKAFTLKEGGKRVFFKDPYREFIGSGCYFDREKCWKAVDSAIIPSETCWNTGSITHKNQWNHSHQVTYSYCFVDEEDMAPEHRSLKYRVRAACSAQKEAAKTAVAEENARLEGKVAQALENRETDLQSENRFLQEEVEALKEILRQQGEEQASFRLCTIL